MASKENDSDETDSEEIEPKFKYHRMANDLQTILNKDVVTCSAVHAKFLIFGTFLGRVYLLDHQGNSIFSNLNDSRSEFAHTVAVNQVDVDDKGEFVASCSDDGKVNVTNLFTKDNNHNLSLGKSIKAIALDTDSKTGGGKRFIVGDNTLTLWEQNFFKKLKSTTLATAEGYVLSVCWNGSFVAWASCLGVRVYDLQEKCSLGLMKWEKPENARLENFRCNLRWSNATTLLIGWVDTIRICVIRKRNSIEASSRDLPVFIVDPISTFQTAFFICGIAPLTGNQLVVLGYPKEKDEEHKALRPVLCVMEFKLNCSEEICTDTLSLRGYKEYTVNDYSLCCIMEENRYFIVAPKDIVVASLYDSDDRIQWLIEHRKFEEALALISAHPNVNYSYIPVARLYINHLISLKQFEAAGKLCLRFFGNNKSLWEEEVFKFVKHGELRAVSSYLPTSEHCKLDKHVYEMVLYEYLRNDAKGFLNLIKEWQSHLYDCSAVINAIRDNFRKQDANELLEALALLYLYQQDYESALRMYLKLQNKDVFELIKRYNLYGVIHKMIIPLIELDQESAFKILLNKSNIPPQIVVPQLEKNQKLLYSYLDALVRVDNSGTYDWKLVNLYAEFDREKLLPFLRRSKHYPIKEALDVCTEKQFYPEMVYLLGQMGNTTEALNIIINKLEDIKMAVDFCKEYEDSDLWNVLIEESEKNPQITTALLEGIIGYVDPAIVVEKIKKGQKIPDLRKSLIKLVWDYRLQGEIQQTVHEMQLEDYFGTHAELVGLQNRGINISYENNCSTCQRPVINKDVVPRNDLIVFQCGHAYHEPCVPGRFTNEHCKLCDFTDFDDDDDDEDDDDEIIGDDGDDDDDVNEQEPAKDA